MNFFISALASTDALPWSKRLSTAGIVTLEGMLAVFAVLTILWGAIEILHFCLAPKKKKTSAPANVPVTEAPAAPEPIPEVVETCDDGELVAVITAAVIAARAEEGNTTGFRVVSFKRAGQR